MKFVCEAVREKDASGRLIKAGAEWTERRVWVWMLGTIVAGCGFGFALLGSPLIFLTKFHPAALAFVGGAAAVGLLAVWAGGTLDERDAAVIFHADGRVEMPYGHPWYRSITELNGPHDLFVSIEAHSAIDERQGHDVRMYTEDGDIVFAAMSIGALEAHRIAVMLTKALTVMRDSRSDPNTRHAA